MFQHGLMILNYGPKTTKSLLTQVGSYIRLASNKISKTLYVSLETNNNNNVVDYRNDDMQKIVPAIYVEAHRRAPLLDVRVLHHSYYHCKNGIMSTKRSLQFRPQILFTNEQWKDDLLQQYLSRLNLTDDHTNMAIVSLSADQSSDPMTMTSPMSVHNTQQPTLFIINNNGIQCLSYSTIIFLPLAIIFVKSMRNGNGQRTKKKIECL